jgi:large subunit ribosomal protein L2
MILRKLTTILKKKSGRNNSGKITVRHRGGRHKRLYRMISLNNRYQGVARILRIEYDPNRTGKIALLWFPNGILCYMLCAHNVIQGQKILIGGDIKERYKRHNHIEAFAKKNNIEREDSRLRLFHHADLQEGNILPLRYIPLGSWVFNVSLLKNERPTYGRAAGVYLRVVSKKISDNKKTGYAGLALPSGQIIFVDLEVKVTIGRVSNVDHKLKKLYKAGQNRWRGWRPSVRGVAMNPVDHPHGGGEGKTSGGRPSVSAWGKLTKGVKTKKKKKVIKTKIITRRRNKLENYKSKYEKRIGYYFHKLKYFGRKDSNYFKNNFKNNKKILLSEN